MLLLVTFAFLPELDQRAHIKVSRTVLKIWSIAGADLTSTSCTIGEFFFPFIIFIHTMWKFCIVFCLFDYCLFLLFPSFVVVVVVVCVCVCVCVCTL